MSKAKTLLKHPRMVVLMIFIVFALFAIHPSPNTTGVSIRSVVPNSSANLGGIPNPDPTSTPMSKERITMINNMPIKTVADYFSVTSDLKPNMTVHIITNKDTYSLKTRPLIETIYLDENETIEITETVLTNKTFRNTTTDETFQKEVEENITKTVTRQKTESNILGTENIGLSIYQAPVNNIRKGLDLQGGTRVLLEPEEKVSPEDMSVVLDNMKERINVYGLTDVVIREAGDLSGGQFVLVEVAGANEAEVKDLIGKQGKFEAKIGENKVFTGGEDIAYVCWSSDCSGIDPYRGCGQSNGQWFCNFRFSISLSSDAAENQAELTKDLEIVSDTGQEYLSEKLDLYLDDALVDSLNIGADLRGKALTDIQISGSAIGPTQNDALTNALDEMKHLQTVLTTGSLPVKLNIIKTDSISPVLGKEFLRNAIVIGLAAMLAVALSVLIRYRKVKIAVPVVLTVVCEVIILLGVASLIGWDLDLAAIAGIIIAIGTSVDHCIVISDETLRGHTSGHMYDWKKKIKNAFFIIMAAYFTTVVALVPLLFAGAGLLKGFALTTILGVSIGVFITRPAFAAATEILIKE